MTLNYPLMLELVLSMRGTRTKVWTSNPRLAYKARDKETDFALSDCTENWTLRRRAVTPGGAELSGVVTSK